VPLKFLHLTLFTNTNRYEKRVHTPGYTLREESELFKHWARETLIALSQLHEQSAEILLNAHDIGPENVMLARQGTSTRLGRLLWGPHFDPNTTKAGVKQFFRERECALLRGFGRILRSLLSAEGEKESVKKFCPSVSVTNDVKKLMEQVPSERASCSVTRRGNHTLFELHALWQAVHAMFALKRSVLYSVL